MLRSLTSLAFSKRGLLFAFTCGALSVACSNDQERQRAADDAQQENPGLEGNHSAVDDPEGTDEPVKPPGDTPPPCEGSSCDENGGWVRIFGTSENDEVHCLTVDEEENIFVGGDSDDVLNPEPNGFGGAGGTGVGGAGGTTGAPTGAFVRKYNSAGQMLWSDQFGGWSSWVNDIVVDQAGNTYAVGVTHEPLDGEHAGWWDAYVRKYSPDGEPLWTRQIGTDEYEIST